MRLAWGSWAVAVAPTVNPARQWRAAPPGTSVHRARRTEVSSRGGQMLRSRGRQASSAFWCRLLRWISVSSPWGQTVLP